MPKGEHKWIYFNTQFFETPNLLNSYWAGVIAADGTVRGKTNEIKIKLAELDKEHLKRFCSDVEYEGSVKNSKAVHPAVYVSMSSQQWKKDLETNFNIVPQKTKKLLPPNIGDIDQKFCYIAGYIDGDGSIFYDDPGIIRFAIYSTPFLLNWIQELFDEYFPPSGRYKVSTPHPGKGCWQYRISGERCSRILQHLNYYDIPKLDRKWSKVSKGDILLCH
jgi:hypothetical protein